jgi:hypothetical protein
MKMAMKLAKKPAASLTPAMKMAMKAMKAK